MRKESITVYINIDIINMKLNHLISNHLDNRLLRNLKKSLNNSYRHTVIANHQLGKIGLRLSSYCYIKCINILSVKENEYEVNSMVRSRINLYFNCDTDEWFSTCAN